MSRIVRYGSLNSNKKFYSFLFEFNGGGSIQQVILGNKKGISSS